jgi:predicted nucleic acid-binding protein
VTERPVRLCLDVNVWISYLIGLQHGRNRGAIHTIVAMAQAMRAGERPVQLVISMEMLGTVERVLASAGFSETAIVDFSDGLLDLVRSGPELLDPYLLISGRDQLGLHDREDAGVLAMAIASRTDLLLTDNLDDFRTRGCAVVKTRQLKTGGKERQLYCIVHERQDGVCLLVAHPIDAANWLLEGLPLTPEAIRDRYRQ